MGKIHIEFDTEYEKGDLVIFEKDGMLLVGIIEGYYVDSGAGDSIWYNIRINENSVFSYTNGGDIAEWDILTKIDNNEKIKKFIDGKYN